jgi:hypothetical protein
MSSEVRVQWDHEQRWAEDPNPEATTRYKSLRWTTAHRPHAMAILWHWRSLGHTARLVRVRG